MEGFRPPFGRPVCGLSCSESDEDVEGGVVVTVLALSGFAAEALLELADFPSIPGPVAASPVFTGVFDAEPDAHRFASGC